MPKTQATARARSKTVTNLLCKIITIAQQKGGVGKTTWTRILAEYFAIVRKIRVLLIDLDPQCNLSQRFLVMERDPVSDEGVLPPIHPEYDPTDESDDWDGRSPITNIFDGKTLVPYPTHIPGIEIFPGRAEKLRSVIEASKTELKERVIQRLAEFLRMDDVQKNWDIILIDTPPAQNALTEGALRAATHLLMPMEVEPQAAEGLLSMVNYWRIIQRTRDEDDPLNLLGVLPNKVRHVALHDGILASLREDSKVSKFILPFDVQQRIAYAEADHAAAKPRSVLQLPEKDVTRREALAVCQHIEAEVFGNVSE